MANVRSAQELEKIRNSVILTAAKLFLTNGFSNTSVKQISEESGVPIGTIFYEMKSKDEILSELVRYVLEGQFSQTAKLLKGKTEDKILFYAAETTLQLHIAESNEHIRELYAAAYSLPKSTEYIQHTVTDKLEGIFKEHLPDLETKDFFELEIASGGIMRNFMLMPCDMYFTMDRKVRRFLETTFLVYEVLKKKINEAVEFVSQFDFKAIAQNTVDTLLQALEEKTVQL